MVLDEVCFGPFGCGSEGKAGGKAQGHLSDRWHC